MVALKSLETEPYLCRMGSKYMFTNLKLRPIYFYFHCPQTARLSAHIKRADSRYELSNVSVEL